MSKPHCRDFKPSATAAWLCAWWKTEEVLISFSPYKTGIGGFCSRIPRADRDCETRGLRLMPRADQEDDGWQDAVDLGETR